MFYGSLRQNSHHWHLYSSVPSVNRGEIAKMQVDTPESWHTVCLIFAGENFSSKNGWDSI